MDHRRSGVPADTIRTAKRKNTADNRQLLAGLPLGEGLEPEPLGHERQGVERPVLQDWVVVLGLLEGDQAIQGLGDLVAPALVVTVVPLRSAEEERQLTCDRRFFCEDNFQATVASAISPTPLHHRSAFGGWEWAHDSGEETTFRRTHVSMGRIPRIRITESLAFSTSRASPASELCSRTASMSCPVTRPMRCRSRSYPACRA